MKYLPLFTCLLLSILLSACSLNPVTVSMSTTHFDNPEVSSKPLKVNLVLALGSQSILTIEDDLNNDDGTDMYDFYRGNITATTGLEISIRGDGDSVTRVGIKYQFYGAYTEQSSQGNLSQALIFGYERNTTSEQYYSNRYYADCEQFCCDSISDIGVWEHDTKVYDIAWVIGYKLTERDIIYGGPFYQW